MDPLPQPAYDGTVAAVLSSITAGDGTIDRAVQRLVSESGMQPAEAQDMIELGAAMHTESLTRDLEKTGLITRAEAPEFYEWCADQRRLPEALSLLIHGGTTKVFRQLAQEFVTRPKKG